MNKQSGINWLDIAAVIVISLWSLIAGVRVLVEKIAAVAGGG